ncbi:MAG: LysM peptidoglycan-binding domain-containing protein [Ilumatobacteraceae bacterium]|nr:LysM peptidoglycan-binding domain-containing protein [Ilumatobacteraceae bacterium]
MTTTLHTAHLTLVAPIAADSQGAVDSEMVRSSAPNYTYRRIGAAVVASVLLVLAAAASVTAAEALIGFGGRPAAASETASDPDFDTVRAVSHVAQPGDSLWSIADHYRGDVDRTTFVNALIDLNGGTFIQAGQAVRLP